MADSALFVGWNRSVHGKEKEALEVLSSALAFYGKQAAAGVIESFEPVLLSHHGGDLNGFVLIRGDGPKLDAFAQSDEFRDLLLKADMCVNGIGVIHGYVGEGMMRELARFQKTIT